MLVDPQAELSSCREGKLQSHKLAGKEVRDGKGLDEMLGRGRSRSGEGQRIGQSASYWDLILLQ